MVGPLRFDGPVSGIDYTSIIEKMLEVQRRPAEFLKLRIDEATKKKNALLDVNITLLGLKSSADALSRPSFFNSIKVSSSNDSVLTASGSSAALGAYTFTSRKLATPHQQISNGYADSNTTAVTSVAATIGLEVGGGYLERRTPVSFLNGQAGFDRGSIRITDSAGKVGIVDLSAAVTAQDIVDEINASTSVSVKASVSAFRLVVQDAAGGAGSLTIADVGADATATSLGIAGTSVTVSGIKYVFGTNIQGVNASTPLAQLNDGLGVRRTSDGVNDFRITRAGGGTVDVDLQAADLTVQDVINRINTAAGFTFAGLSTGGDSIVLTDTGGGGSVSVSQLNGSMAAVDLGFGTLSGATFTSNTAESTTTGVVGTGRRLVGNSLVPGLNTTLRTLLNGGSTNQDAADLKGISGGTISVTDRSGVNTSSLDVSHRFATTFTANASAGATTVTVNSVTGLGVGNRVRFHNNSNTVDYRTIVGISGTTLTLDKALTTNINNGDGIVGLNDSLQDIANVINTRAAANSVDVRAEINDAGSGLRIVDFSGGSGNLIVANGTGTAAADLGIVGSVAANTLDGTDLDVQWLGENTALSTLNGGSGVLAGKVHILDTGARQFDVDLSQSTDNTLGKVINEINAIAAANGSGVVARMNNTGDGLLLTDTTPGAGTLQVQEVDGGRTAKDLGLLGTAPAATPTKLDGSFEVQVSIAANTTLQGVADAINAKGLGVTAAVINDGSAFNPYKLTLTSTKSGQAGRVTVNSGVAGLTFKTTAAAQDAVVLYGSGGTGIDPAILTSSTNTLTGIVSGLTLELKSPSSTPVTVTVSRDTQSVVDQAQNFVDSYNDAIKKIRDYTAFNADTFSRGLLFTDPTVLRIRRDLSNQVLSPVVGLPASVLNSLSEVGIKAGAEGTLTFDSGTFSSKLASDFNGVQDLFILQRKLDLGTLLKDVNSGTGVTDVSGSDFTVLARNGTTKFNVDLAGAKSVGSLLQAINTASGNGGIIKAQISSDGFSIELVDSSTIVSRTVGASPTTTSFVASEADLTGLADNRIVGSTIKFTSGPNSGQIRKVSAFDTGTNTITLDSALSVAPATGNTYTLEREVEVQKFSTNPTASELKLLKKATLGQNTLKGDILGLQGDPGAAARMSEALDFITRSGDGLVTRRTDALDDIVEDLQKSIERIEAKIKKAQESLIRKFTQLEKVIAQSQSTSQRLTALLSGVLGQSGSGGAF